MKRRLVLIMFLLGITVSALTFTGTNDNSDCPLIGTSECPEYPS